MNRHTTLAAGLAVGAAIGYGRMRRRFPIVDLPLPLRIRAALTMPPARDRLTAARAALLGGSVVVNVDVDGHAHCKGTPAVVASCTIRANQTGSAGS